MIFLPRGNPVRQKVNPARINLSQAMEKLRVGKFTGYLHFNAKQGTGVILFNQGQLISSVFIKQDETERLIAYDAIARIFEVTILGNAILDIFSLSSDLVLGIHALLHGRYLQKGQDLSCLDVRKQLETIKSERLTVCLRIYAEDKTALIFYDQGCALGFFHEGGTELDPIVDISASVAHLPGAKLDVLEICSTDEIALADLMGSADLGLIWQRTHKM
ncbi:MAG: GTPase-activating protein, partial [Desulfuromusa sp.]|nr:GTPase-activating protein [Desulfuromusa sp.]